MLLSRSTKCFSFFLFFFFHIHIPSLNDSTRVSSTKNAICTPFSRNIVNGDAALFYCIFLFWLLVSHSTHHWQTTVRSKHTKGGYLGNGRKLCQLDLQFLSLFQRVSKVTSNVGQEKLPLNLHYMVNCLEGRGRRKNKGSIKNPAMLCKSFVNLGWVSDRRKLLQSLSNLYAAFFYLFLFVLLIRRMNKRYVHVYLRQSVT